MKRIIILALFLNITRIVPGQQSTDLLLRAKALNETGKPDLTIEMLNRPGVEIKDSRIYSERAEAYLKKGDYSAASSDFNEANKLVPGSGEYGLAILYSLKGDASTSLYHLEQHLNSSFRKSEKEIVLEPAFSRIENRPEWRQFWKKEWYNGLETGISEIGFYISAGRIDEARSVVSDLKVKYNGSQEVIYAEALLNSAAGKNSDVVKAMNELLVSSPGKEKYLRLLAKAQAATGNAAGASVTYTGLLDSGVADAGLFLMRAGCYRKTGEYRRALDDIEKYLEYYPENKDALSMAGKVNISLGDNIRALEFFSRNLKIYPNDADCYIDRGNSYLAAKSWDWAIKDYSMSLDLNPSNSDAWLNKGISLVNSGKANDACHDFRMSLNLGNKRASEYISKYCIK